MRLTDRDIEIFGFLLDENFASLSQLHRRFWRGVTTQASYARFKKLERGGFIEQKEVNSKYPVIYQLSREGYKVLDENHLNGGLELYSYIDLRTFNHDLCLKDIRIIFYELGIK